MTKPLKIAIVYGSARDGRFCDTIADWVFSRLWERADVEILIVDPAELWNAGGRGGPREKASLAQTLGEADGFIVVTPEYNHAYPAPLKHLINSFKSEWRAKPVAFVSYGGISGGLRAVEQLRLVFAELRATTIRDTVSFANAWTHFDEKGAPFDPEGAELAFHALLTELIWWAVALDAARRGDRLKEVAA